MKIICVGLNYHAHNKEMNRAAWSINDDPVLFMKPESALCNNDKKHFFIPDFSQNIHYEAELVVKIDKLGKNIAERFAHRYYSEITIGLDLTARDIQTKLKEKSLPWEIAKAFDNSAVVGRFMPKENWGSNIQALNFQLVRNNELVQSGNSSEMIHSIDSIISYASRFFTLKTGDLLFTGTPAGVGRIAIGDYLQGYIEGDELLDIHIC